MLSQHRPYKKHCMNAEMSNLHLNLLGINLDTTVLPWCRPRAKLGQQVGDVVPWMPVEASAQPLLVEEVGNQTDAAAEHEQTVEHTHLEIIFGFFGRKGAAVAHEVDKADGDAAVDVEDEVVLLGGGDLFDGESVVKRLGIWEVLLDELLDKLDTKVRVVAGLDPVADTGD